jgi:hypothetical protein
MRHVLGTEFLLAVGVNVGENRLVAGSLELCGGGSVLWGQLLAVAAPRSVEFNEHVGVGADDIIEVLGDTVEEGGREKLALEGVGRLKIISKIGGDSMRYERHEPLR